MLTIPLVVRRSLLAPPRVLPLLASSLTVSQSRSLLLEVNSPSLIVFIADTPVSDSRPSFYDSGPMKPSDELENFFEDGTLCQFQFSWKRVPH